MVPRSRRSLIATFVMIVALVLVVSMFLATGVAFASYASDRPDLGVAADHAFWGSYADYMARQLTVKYVVSNNGATNAFGVSVTDSANSDGVTLTSSTPAGIGDIAAGGSGSVNLTYNVPDGVSVFNARLSATGSDSAGTSYSYHGTDLNNLAYVENTGGAGITPGVSVIDMQDFSVVNKFEDAARAGSAQGHFISLSPDGRYIWHSEDAGSATGYVEVLDVTTGERVPGKYWAVGAGVGNLMTKTTVPGGHHYVFITNQQIAPNGPGISVFDVDAQAYLGQIPLPTGSAPHLIIDTPDENTLWTYTGSSTTSRAISFDISGITKAAPGSEVLPTAIKDSVTVGGSLHAMVMYPNGKYILMGSSTNGIAVVDLTTATPSLAAVHLGGMGSEHNFTMSPDGTHLLVGEESAYT